MFYHINMMCFGPVYSSDDATDSCDTDPNEEVYLEETRL